MIGLLDPGDRLDHMLILERHLGSLGVAYVMRDLRPDADDIESLRPAVLVGKTLRPEFAADRSHVARFEAECHNWLTLGLYRHVVRLYYVDRFSGQLFAFAEHIPQAGLPNTLRGWLKHNLVEFESAMRFAVQVCRALTFAERRGLVAHGDLKPENVLVTPRGVAKVNDWGLSRLLRARNGTERPVSGRAPYPYRGDSTSVRGHGTLGYAAPELLRGDTEPTARSDLFSLAVLVTEMLTGRRPPFDAPVSSMTPAGDFLGPARRDHLAEVLSACLSARPEERPDSAAAVETACARAFEDAVGVPVEAEAGDEGIRPADLGQRAHSLFVLGRLDEAMRLQEKALSYVRQDGDEEQPRHTVILMDYKEHGLRTIIPRQLLDDADEAVRQDPGSAERAKESAGLHDLAGNPERAVELYEQALGIDPDDGEALAAIAHVLGQLGRCEEALGYVDRAIAQAPDARLWQQRSALYEQIGDRAKALRAAQEAVALAPRDPEALTVRGRLLAEGGDHTGAEADFRAAVETDGDNTGGLMNLAITLMKLERFEEARDFVARAVELEPDFVRGLNTLGTLHLHLGAEPDALACFQRAVAVDPRYARAWYNLGLVHESWDQTDRAREAFHKALETDPAHARAREALERLDA
ncbi:tetratricopeptide repeat protein [Streptomyces sp. NPDC046915]|uniref:tetratricopeptide repeat protein n=1 Tax=Streptomyces sp. NPDC046915 TaxID=3155257 RepID=UPI0033E2FB7B